MKEYFLKKKGLYYRKNDFDSNKKTIIFIHGVYGSSSAWIHHEKEFINKYNVINFDQRGHGKSRVYKKFEDYSVGKFVEDLNDLIDYLQIKDFILIAHSMGSQIALDYLITYPNRASAAILLSPNMDTGRAWLGKILNKRFLNLIVKIENKFKKSRMGEHVDYSKYLNSSDWDMHRSWADLKNTGLSTYLFSIKNFCNFNRRDEVKNIQTPVLIIHGKKDSIFPLKNSIEMSKTMPNAEIKILENADHIIIINHFDKIIKIINEYLNITSKKDILS